IRPQPAHVARPIDDVVVVACRPGVRDKPSALLIRRVDVSETAVWSANHDLARLADATPLTVAVQHEHLSSRQWLSERLHAHRSFVADEKTIGQRALGGSV